MESHILRVWRPTLLVGFYKRETTPLRVGLYLLETLWNTSYNREIINKTFE